MKITVKCPSCGQEFSKEFNDNKVCRVMSGELVQDVFPELSADERELFFISHICPTCWNNIFAEVDEEMDNYIQEKIELTAEEFADSK